MDEYEILLNGDFGWDITVDGFRSALVDANGRDLNIKLSSDGGSVKDSTIIRNDTIAYMKDNNAKVNFEIVGWAQSAASHWTTIKGATVSISDETLYMYHNPITGVYGDYVAMEVQAVILKTMAETFAIGYASKSGTDKKEILEGMKKTTILIGQEIIDAGFADKMIETESDEKNETELKSRDSLIEMSKSRYTSTSNRVAMAAIGKKDTEDLENKNEHVNAPEKKEINMSDPKKTEPKNPDLVDDKARAIACMKAQAAMPDQIEMLTKQFEAGMSADHFNGMVAHVDMVAASKKEEEAKDEAVVPIVPKEQEVETVMKKTAGRSGQTVEVK